MSKEDPKLFIVDGLRICELCLDGDGGECHVPGCMLIRSAAPDIPVRESIISQGGFIREEVSCETCANDQPCDKHVQSPQQIKIHSLEFQIARLRARMKKRRAKIDKLENTVSFYRKWSASSNDRSEEIIDDNGELRKKLFRYIDEFEKKQDGKCEIILNWLKDREPEHDGDIGEWLKSWIDHFETKVVDDTTDLTETHSAIITEEHAPGIFSGKIVPNEPEKEDDGK